MNTRNIFKVMLAVLLSIASLCSAGEGTWTRKADMPTARFGLSTVAVDGIIYAIGGGQSPYGTYLSTVEAYDPATDTWTRKTDMPTNRSGHAVGVVNGKIYVIGGEPSAQAFISTVEEYDPAVDSWARKADMPTKRSYLCACVVNGKIYAIGGRAAGDPPDPGPSTLEVYDPATDSWAIKADMPIQRSAAAACVMDGKIYVIGGVTDNSHEAPFKSVYEYDPVTNVWSRKADMPTARVLHSASVIGGKIYVFGGSNYGTGLSFSTVEEYDPATDTWTSKSDMPTARYMHASSAVEGKIYTFGGTSIFWPWTGITTVEEYDLTPLPPDFNGDGLVDIKDLIRLIELWGQADPMIDIAPPPFGDGIVDAQDLELLMSYWGQPIDDPTLIAHWALDETEGNIAVDSVSEDGYSDGYVFGDPVWQPAGGQANGAIQLDGVDDYIITSPLLNPATGPFSVLAWIQGGAPGQVVISQLNGANWLRADPTSGCLMTELCPSGRNGVHLQSETGITDGNWHRVGFVWDGLNRSLYVDDLLVAEDVQDGLESSNGDMYIGTGLMMAPGTYFSGLIDDVRIYNRVAYP